MAEDTDCARQLITLHITTQWVTSKELETMKMKHQNGKIELQTIEYC